jgi:segregation and condensation protein A
MLEETVSVESVTERDFVDELSSKPVDLLQDPVEILVTMAENGEIDPWHIDIVEITDKFLNRIKELERLDLRISGRTLFYASVLLRMKSNALLEPEIAEDEGEEEGFFDDLTSLDVEDYPIPTPPLRRKSMRPATLDELITELKKAEVVERRRRSRLEGKKRDVEKPNADKVFGIAHEENIERRVQLLNEKLCEVFKAADRITFNELLSQNGDDKVMTFLALLFLAGRRKIWLEQEELFGELIIRSRS